MQRSAIKLRTSSWREAWLIVFVALAVRLVVALLAYGGRDIVTMLWPRGVEALGIARSLLSGAGFSSPFAVNTGPTAFLTPIYPLILAAVERVFGTATPASAWVIILLQCGFSALTCFAIYMLTAETLDEKIARRAASIWALFPYAVILPTNIIWDSPLSALLLTFGLYLFLLARKSDSSKRWLLAGAFWALACLVNASLLLLLPALLLLNVNRIPRHQAFLCLGALLLCLLPWSVRNYLTFHKFFPLRDNFALELWIGNHDGATTRFTPEIHPAFSESEMHRYQQLGEIGYMKEKRDIAFAFIQQRPALFVRNTVKRMFVYWFVNWHALWYLVPLVSFAGFLGLALMLARSHSFAWIFWLALALYPVPFYLTHPDVRYQHPVQPLLVILCAYATTALGTKVSNRVSERDLIEVSA
jgi:4-amino-4-deoxy-L-arabinose transferase-like glycosyltransferase